MLMEMNMWTHPTHSREKRCCNLRIRFCLCVCRLSKNKTLAFSRHTLSSRRNKDKFEWVFGNKTINYRSKWRRFSVTSAIRSEVSIGRRIQISSTTQWLASRLSWQNESIKNHSAHITEQQPASGLLLSSANTNTRPKWKIGGKFPSLTTSTTNTRPSLHYQHLMTRCSNFHFHFYYFSSSLPFAGCWLSFFSSFCFWLNHNLFVLIKFVLLLEREKRAFSLGDSDDDDDDKWRTARRRRWYLADTKHGGERASKEEAIWPEWKSFHIFLNIRDFSPHFSCSLCVSVTPQGSSVMGESQRMTRRV